MSRRNADKPSVFLRLDRGWLKPETSYDAEVLGRYANGAVVEVVLHEPQSEQQARLLWRVLSIVADNSDYANAEALMTALKVRLRHVDSVSLIGGGLHLIPRSLKDFDKAGLSRFFDQAMTVIADEVIPGLDVDRLVKEGRIVLGRRA